MKNSDILAGVAIAGIAIILGIGASNIAKRIDSHLMGNPHAVTLTINGAVTTVCNGGLMFVSMADGSVKPMADSRGMALPCPKPNAGN